MDRLRPASSAGLVIPTLPDEWADTMAEPRVWGAWLAEWLENTPPMTRADNDSALRALQSVRSEINQVIDQLEVWQRQHDAQLPMVKRMAGDDAMDHADARERLRETLELDDAIDEAHEADYRDHLERRRRPVEDDARGDRDLPGYDRRSFGADDAEVQRPPRRRRDAPD